MGGRKVAGYVQIILGLAGFLITLVALVKIAFAWVQDFQLPADASLYRSAIIGMAVFLGAWTWSLLTSLALLRESEKPSS